MSDEFNYFGKAKVRRTLKVKALPRTHCYKGHPYSGENLYVSPEGRRQCVACRKANLESYRSVGK
jgi:hypothetical protein